VAKKSDGDGAAIRRHGGNDLTLPASALRATARQALF
jgi:hypothetical protein